MNRVQWDRWNQWKMKLCSKKWSKVRIIIILHKFTLLRLSPGPPRQGRQGRIGPSLDFGIAELSDI